MPKTYLIGKAILNALPLALCAFALLMKGVIFDQHGGPEVLKLADVPAPQINSTEVLVEVRACALNHLDVWTRNGLPGITIPLPHILGCDVAGVVRAVGELVTWVKAGDEVMIQPGVSCRSEEHTSELQSRFGILY